MAKTQLAMIKEDTVDIVAQKVQQFQERGELHFPENYSPENAMKSAWLTLQTIKTGKQDGYRPALEVCTRDSVANALLSMVIQGLNPDKKQGYFIVYGKQLVFQRSYFGTMAVTKRVTGAKSIDAAVIFDADEVDYEMRNGRIINLSHKQKFGSINKDKIDGAYCTITMPGGEVYNELMTIDEIRQAWSMSQMWGKDQKTENKGSTHDGFKQEMCKKTVINRACKKFMNSSDDSSLVIQHFNRQDESLAEAEADAEIIEHANTEPLDVDVDHETGEIIEDHPENEQEEPNTGALTADEIAEMEAEEQGQMAFAGSGKGPNF